jgi:hypothetical protein
MLKCLPLEKKRIIRVRLQNIAPKGGVSVRISLAQQGQRL